MTLTVDLLTLKNLRTNDFIKLEDCVVISSVDDLELFDVLAWNLQGRLYLSRKLYLKFLQRDILELQIEQTKQTETNKPNKNI